LKIGLDAANGASVLSSDHHQSDSIVDDAVLKTLVYADLYDYPLKAEEIYEGLLAASASLGEVKRALQVWENRGLVAHSGTFFFMQGHAANVNLRQERWQHSRALLKKHAWLLRLIIRFPLVRSVALSGALAFENCRRDDDIDLFILADGGRLWIAHAALVVMLNFLKKRRIICLNCLCALDRPNIDDRDFFVAHQIAFLRPLSGLEHFQKFCAANAWIEDYLPQRRAGGDNLLPAEISALITAGPLTENPWLKRLTEKILSWPVFDYLETWIFRLYSRRIQRLTGHLRPGSVVVRPGQIKLFTNDHRHHIKNALQRRLQEIWLHCEEVKDEQAVF
jgi:hypothetical protein